MLTVWSAIFFKIPIFCSHIKSSEVLRTILYSLLVFFLILPSNVRLHDNHACFMKNIALLFLLFFLLHGKASTQALNDAYQQARTLYHAGEYDQATEIALQSLIIARKEQGLESNSYRQALRLLSLIAYSSASYDKGMDYACREVKLGKRLHKKPDREDADALYNLSLFQLKLDKSDEALASIEEALDIYKAQQLAADETFYRLQLLLSRIYLKAGMAPTADSVLNHILPGLENKPELAPLTATAYYLTFKSSLKDSLQGDIHQLKKAFVLLRQEEIKEAHAEEFYQVLEALAQHYQQDLKLDEARNMYLQMHQLFEEQHLRDSLRWSGVLNNLGVLTVKTDPSAASKWLAMAFELQKKISATRDNAFWSSLDNYAMSLHRQSKSEEALALYQHYTAQLAPNQHVGTAFATAMNNQAMILRNRGRTQEALSCLYYAEKLSQQAEAKLTKNERLKLSTLYYNLAQTHQLLSQYDTAIYYYKKSTEESKLINATMSAEYLAAINGMAGLYHDIGYFTEAEIFYAEALHIQDSLGGKNTNVYASILSNYALLQQDRGAYGDALDYFEEALQIKGGLLGPDHPDYIAVVANLGLLYLDQANYEQSRRMLETALVRYENIFGREHPQLVYALINLARLEIALGNYPAAEPLLKEALLIQEKNYGPDHPAYAMTAVEMGNFYMLLGNYEAAAPLLEHSRDLLEKRYGKTHPSYATATQNLAVLAEALGNLALAEAYLLETLEIDQRTLGKQNPRYAVTLNNLASFYQNNDSVRKAMPLLKEAMSIFQNVLAKNHPLYTATLLNLALLYQDLQQFRKAEPLIAEVVRLRKSLLGDRHPDYAYALYGQAVNAYRLKEYEQAKQLFQQVINLYAWQIREYFPVLSEKEKSAFYQRIEPVLNTYRDFVININLLDDDILISDKDALIGSLYDLQLLTKAMLLDASSKIRRSIFQSEDPALIELYEQWHELKEQLAKYYALSAQELQRRNIRMDKLEDRANELEKSLSGQSRLFAQSLAKQEYNWRDVQQRLGASEAAIEMIRVENEASQQVFYTALVLDSLLTSPRMVILPQGEAMENKNFNYYKNAIAYRIEDEYSYDLYWRPVSEVLSPGVRRVYVAPDGVYNKISLISLYNTHDKTFLLDELDLRMLSSTRELLDDEIEDAPISDRPLALLLGFPDYFTTASLSESAVVDYSTEGTSPRAGQNLTSEQQVYDFRPLPGTAQEINHIEGLMQQAGWRIEKLSGPAASEEKVKHMSMPHVLHVATHGYFLKDLSASRNQKTFGIHIQNIGANPLLRSGLLLAGAATRQGAGDSLNLEAEDGVLTAYEAMNLNLSETELVVLSACETALGEVKNGEGVYGLQRAFLVAGAKSVLMSLWKVSDESTTELIRLFYKHWLEGQDKFSALANAQRSIREKYGEPYHWGPFVLIGI